MTPSGRRETRDAIVAEPDGFRPLMLDLFRPDGAATPAPLVICIHGGAWRMGTNKREAPPLVPARIGERILGAGYALARVTYRLSGEACFPVTYASAGAPPMLLLHGEEDRIVPHGQSEELHTRLTAAGARTELRIVPGADHCFLGVDAGPLVDEGIEFLNRTLGG